MVLPIGGRVCHRLSFEKPSTLVLKVFF